jgi:hypothetical protein
LKAIKKNNQFSFVETAEYSKNIAFHFYPYLKKSRNGIYVSKESGRDMLFHPHKVEYIVYFVFYGRYLLIVKLRKIISIYNNFSLILHFVFYFFCKVNEKINPSNILLYI